jgi:hypothetical protein
MSLGAVIMLLKRKRKRSPISRTLTKKRSEPSIAICTTKVLIGWRYIDYIKVVIDIARIMHSV